jgi:nucleotide-binding universal stress UspA family protein
MQLKSILCPVDFSDFSAAAYQYAVSLAEHYQAKLIALHVTELWKYPFADYGAYEADFGKVSNAMKEGGEERLRKFVESYSAGNIELELISVMGNASDCTLSVAETKKVEVIVMGTHGRSGFDRLVLGSTTDRVMRKAPCPVLVVSSPEHCAMTTGPDGRHRLTRILFCTDFSHQSQGALEYAVSVAREYGAELTLLHVAESDPGPAKRDAIIAERTQALENLISKTERDDLNLKISVGFGKAYQEIVQHAAAEQGHLIIMTARGADAVDRAIFGSTTYRVIQLGPCPVLAIHT